MQPERPDRRNRVAVAAAVVGAAVVLTVQLFVEPVVGLADNGDFERLLGPAGLAHTSARFEERYFGWMQPRFAYTARTSTPSGYRTSEYFLVELAVRASRTLSRAPFFDVRWLGALHALLFLLALGLMVSSCRDLALPAQAAAALLLVFFFTDVGYTAPFQSLYAQTASLLFLLLTAAVTAVAVRRGGLSGVWLPAYFAAAALFVCSKPQEVVHAPLLALLGVRLAWIGGATRRRATSAALAVLLCALAARYGWSGEASHGWITRYNVIFMNILPPSPDPAGDLVELGLDPALARFSGVSAWVAGSPGRDPAFQARVHRTSPRAFLLRHPERLRPMVGEALGSSYVLRPQAFGNFAKESGRPAGTMAPGPWSAARRVFSGWPWLIVLIGGTLTAAAATYRAASRRGRLFRECLSAGAVMAGGAFAVAFAGDTHIELVRHLYTFQALCDLILVADLVWIVQAVATRATRHRTESA